MARIVVEVVGKDAGATAVLNKTSQNALQTGKAVNQLAKDAKAASSVLGGSVAKSANTANSAILELSRGLQDAPFGSIGYINNLQQFQALFGSLARETGSFSGAIKQLGTTLVGPAGLSILFSAVTAGIQIYSMYQQKVNKQTQEAADENKELADSIRTLDQVRSDGRANASEDLSNVQTLYALTQDLNQTQETRLKIAKELISNYPTYLKGFDAEAIVAGKAADAYERLTNAILAKGYVQAAEENRQKLINQQLNANVDLTREQVKLTRLNEQIAKRQAQFEATLSQEGRNALLPGLNDLKDQADESRSSIVEFNKTIADGRGEITLLDNVVKGLVKDFGTEVLFDPDKPKGGKTAAEKLADLIQKLKELRAEFKQTVEFSQISIAANNVDILDGFAESLRKSYDKETEKFKSELKTAKPLIDLPAIVGQTGLSFDTEFDRILAKVTKFNNDISSVINTGLVNGISDIASALGNALATGESAFDAIGNSLLSTFGNVLVQLGKIAIETGIGIKAITTALKTLNPVIAIAAGVGLVALGSLIAGRVSKLGDNDSNSSYVPRAKKPPGFAGGVTNFEGGLAYVHAGELLTNLPTGANVITRANTDRILGGISAGGGLAVEGVLRGQDILLAVKRTQSNNSKI